MNLACSKKHTQLLYVKLHPLLVLSSVQHLTGTTQTLKHCYKHAQMSVFIGKLLTGRSVKFNIQGHSSTTRYSIVQYVTDLS